MGGGDKPLREVGGRSLLAHAIERLEPQVGAMVLNANGDPARFEAFGLPVAPDPASGNPGPLAGVLAGLDWAAEHKPAHPWIVSVPTDAPLFPIDLVDRLLQAAHWDAVPVACATSGGRHHPVFSVWHQSVRDRLRNALLVQDIRKVDAFTATVGLATVDWSVEPADPFMNVNRPDDLVLAERSLGQR